MLVGLLSLTTRLGGLNLAVRVYFRLSIPTGHTIFTTLRRAGTLIKYLHRIINILILLNGIPT